MPATIILIALGNICAPQELGNACLDEWRGRPHLAPGIELTWSDSEREAKEAEWDKDLLAHWWVEANEIVNDGAGVFLTTKKDYGDFEMSLEYKTVAGADSGIYLRGCPQVQIWDWTKEGGKWELGADKGSGGLWNNQIYSRFPSKFMDRPFGEWNQLKIVMVGSYVSVWMNETQVVHHAILENYFDRTRPVPARGPIQLQTHGGEIRWKNISIKELDDIDAVKFLTTHNAEAFVDADDNWSANCENYILRNYFLSQEGEVTLEEQLVRGSEVHYSINGQPSETSSGVRPFKRQVFELGERHWQDGELNGWHKLGEAEFSYDKGVLTGTGDFRLNSFLVSDDEYEDFELNVDVKINSGGNSGIQIRSEINPQGQVAGCQVEIDGSPRSWSGGIYEERGRGWLQNLDNKPESQAAFHLDEWNHYRIRCQGKRIQTWVNGIPCADYQTSESSSGLIAFQVHSGGKTTVSWRKLFIHEL